MHACNAMAQTAVCLLALEAQPVNDTLWVDVFCARVCMTACMQ